MRPTSMKWGLTFCDSCKVEGCHTPHTLLKCAHVSTVHGLPKSFIKTVRLVKDKYDGKFVDVTVFIFKLGFGNCVGLLGFISVDVVAL